MADLTPKPISIINGVIQINNGVEIVLGDTPIPETFNAPIEASAYAQEKSVEANTKADNTILNVQNYQAQTTATVNNLATQIVEKQGTAVTLGGQYIATLAIDDLCQNLDIKSVAEKQPPAYEIGKVVVEHINGDTITTSCGRSRNLFDIKILPKVYSTWQTTDNVEFNTTITSGGKKYMDLTGSQFTFSYWTKNTGTGSFSSALFVFKYSDGTIDYIGQTGLFNDWTFKFGTSNPNKTVVSINASSGSENITYVKEIMLNEGSTALPYEPYALARRLIISADGGLYTQISNGGEWSAKKSAGSGKSGIVYENNPIIEPKWFKVASLPMFSGNTIYTCSLDVQILHPMIVDRIKDYGTLNIGIIASNRTISTTQSYMEFSSYGNTLIANNFIISKDDIYLNIYIKIPTRYNKYVVHLNNEYNLSSFGDGMLTLYNNGIPEAVNPVAILTSTLRQY